MSSSSRTLRALQGILAACFLVLLVLRATWGPDFHEYLLWSHVAKTGDIFRIEHDVLSPSGVPFSQWSHGPGFLLALGRYTAFGPLGERVAALLFAGLFGALFWWAFADVLRLAAGVRPVLAWLGAGLGFVATHLGYYSHVHASESFSFAALALGARWALAGRPGRVLDALVVGSCCALLLLVRPQLLPYGVVVLGVYAVRLRREAPDRSIRLGLCAAAPLAVAAIQVAWANRWMTGSLFVSPYTFGDGGFRSLDPSRPELLAVLVHPWHGLLVYHPFYALAFAALVTRLVAARDASERWLCAAIGAAVLANYGIQASWYCWWLGTGTFGMRGLGVAAVLLVPIFVRHVAALPPRGARAVAWIAAALASALWSLGLLWQGETSFFRFEELGNAQRAAFGAPWFLAPVGAAAAGAWAVLRIAAPKGDRWAGTVAGSLGALVLVYLVGRGEDPHARQPDMPVLPVVLLSLFAACAAAAVGLAAARATVRGVATSWLSVAIGCALLAILAGECVLFARVAARTEAAIANPAPPDRVYRGTAPAQLGEIEATYEEYRMVEGFEDAKERLRAYVATFPGSKPVEPEHRPALEEALRNEGR